MRKIKLICRRENGMFTERIFADGEETISSDEQIICAQRFLRAFHPQEIVQEHSAAYADFVLVFRTDDAQMQEFSELLAQYGGA